MTEQESTPETDSNYAIKQALKALQEERKKDYPTTESFRKAKNHYADFLSDDYHLKAHKDKAEQYKPNTIQYNKHMAVYNERLKEIADLRKEAEAGKTIHEMELEETMRINTDYDTEHQHLMDKREGLKNTDTDTLKKSAFEYNKTWANETLSWKERHAAKDEISEILSVLKDRNVDIISDLNAQLDRIKKGIAEVQEIKPDLAKGETVEVNQSSLEKVIQPTSTPANDDEAIYLSGQKSAEKLGDINDYTRVLYGLASVLKHRGAQTTIDELSHWWHMPLAMIPSNKPLDFVNKAMEAEMDRIVKAPDSYDTTHAIALQNVSWRIGRLDSALHHDPQEDVEGILEHNIKGKYPKIRKNSKEWKEQVEKIGDKALQLAIKNKESNVASERNELKNYYEKDATKAIIRAMEEAKSLEYRADVIQALTPGSPTIKKAQDEARAIRKRVDEYESYFKKYLTMEPVVVKELKEDIKKGETVTVPEKILKGNINVKAGVKSKYFRNKQKEYDDRSGYYNVHEPVEHAHPFTYRDIELFAAKGVGLHPKWDVTEVKTGLLIPGEGKTKEAAIQAAKETIDRITPEKIREMISKTMERMEKEGIVEGSKTEPEPVHEKVEIKKELEKGKTVAVPAEIIEEPKKPKPDLKIVNQKSALILTVGDEEEEYKINSLDAKGFMEGTAFFDKLYYVPYKVYIPHADIEYFKILKYFKTNAKPQNIPIIDEETARFGEKVIVAADPDNPEIYPSYKGMVIRVLNNGRLIEVRPEGQTEGSFRVDASRVTPETEIVQVKKELAKGETVVVPESVIESAIKPMKNVVAIYRNLAWKEKEKGHYKQAAQFYEIAIKNYELHPQEGEMYKSDLANLKKLHAESLAMSKVKKGLTAEIPESAIKEIINKNFEKGDKVPESVLKATVDTEPSAEVKKWMKKAHNIDDYKGGRSDRRSMLTYLLNYYTIGNIRDREEASEVAWALGKDLGYGTPPGTGISWERYFAEKIADETGKDVSIIQNAMVVHPGKKSSEKQPDGTLKPSPHSEPKDPLEGRGHATQEPVIKDTGDPVLNDLLRSIKGAITVTQKNSIGEKITYPKRVDSINYTGTVYKFLLEGGEEPKAPVYLTYEEEHTLFQKAVAAAKKTRALQKPHINKVKAVISKGETAVIPEPILKKEIAIGIAIAKVSDAENQRRVDLMNEKIKLGRTLNVGVFHEGKLIKSGFKDAYSARNFMNDSFFTGSRSNKRNLLNPADFGWTIEKIDEKVEILNPDELLKISQGKTVEVPAHSLVLKPELKGPEIIEMKKELVDGEIVVVPEDTFKAIVALEPSYPRVPYRIPYRGRAGATVTTPLLLSASPVEMLDKGDTIELSESHLNGILIKKPKSGSKGTVKHDHGKKKAVEPCKPPVHVHGYSRSCPTKRRK